MDSESREELISAYVDDELSAEDRARVESWLAESPELRQLHDELRGVRQALRTLPRHQLGEDLGPAVLRGSERAVLRGGDAPAPQSLWLRGAGWRRMVWPAMAVAAALAILVFDQREQANHPAERQVAQAPASEATIQAAPEPAPSAAAAPATAGEARQPAGSTRQPAGTATRARSTANEGGRGAARKDQLDAQENKPADAGPRPATLSDQPPVMKAAPLSGKRDEAAGASLNQQGVPATLPSAEAPLEQGALKGMASLSFACVAPPEYLRDNEFEKLLERYNVAVESNPKKQLPLPNYLGKESTKPTGPNRHVYSYRVVADDAQIDQILAELRRHEVLVKPIESQAIADQKTPAKSRARRVLFNLQAAGESPSPPQTAPSSAPAAAAPAK